MSDKTSKKKVVKTVRNSVILITALVGFCTIIFAFTRPMLAPGSNNGILQNTSNSDSTEAMSNTFDASETNSKIGIGVQADSFLVFDENTGEIIAARNSKAAVAIASITKLMTALIIQKYGNLEDVWAIAPASTNDIRPVLGLQIGDRVVIQDLVNAMLIGSANDAATALGQYINARPGLNIVQLMNDEADKLGMYSTHYENPIGFDSEQNYSTAQDLRLLLREIRHLPLFSSVDRKQSYSFMSENGTNYSIRATNTLIASDPEIHAIKTGFTDEAGGAMITAIYHNDSRFVIIVLGSNDRENDTKILKQQIIESDVK